LSEPDGGRQEPVRVLVVDDLPDNVEILRARLESRGYAVATAANGEEALAAVHADPPQLILCDVMMPGIDGYEVARRIKRDEGLPFIPIILVTALNETEHIVQGLNTGADDYIAKPYHFQELEARVRAMLRIKRLQDELDQKNRELEVANKRLKKLSITDGLTELFNHRHVHELLRDEFERSRRTEEPLGVVMTPSFFLLAARKFSPSFLFFSRVLLRSSVWNVIRVSRICSSVSRTLPPVIPSFSPFM